MAGQALRRSQFITTYGPGAILEGRSGPRVIPALEYSDIFTDDRPIHNFEITDSRLSSALLDGASIVRIPSNAELNLSEARSVYTTTPFPSWALCTDHHILYIKRPEDGGDPRKTCPLCPASRDQSEAWQTIRRQAIRFIMACPNGHLDDVNWVSSIQHKEGCRKPSYLFWKGSGSSLRNITVTCSECERGINLGTAYGREWSCSGRWPERNIRHEQCDAKAKMIQRGAANLRIPELHSALTIPPADTRLHRLLQGGAVRTLLDAGVVSTKDELLTALKRLSSSGRVGPGLIAELERFGGRLIEEAIEQILSEALPKDNHTMRIQEFEALRRAALEGAPPMPASSPAGPPQFEVIRQEVREYIGPGGHHLRVTPVSRLRVVMVQKGYRRLDPLLSRIVDIVYTDEHGGKWYPGVDLSGEGIFIDLSPSVYPDGYHFDLHSGQTWLDALYHPEQYHQRIQRDEDGMYLHPVFVWWHTFAHRLINALSIDSGYSSAAVRERVYIDIDKESGRARGGILLYTVQPGGDGTLGGMMALAARFDRVLRVALDTIDSCSNDPLCGEAQFGDNKYNGSACYACLLVSETSCEHQNTRLDRHILKENLP